MFSTVMLAVLRQIRNDGSAHLHRLVPFFDIDGHEADLFRPTAEERDWHEICRIATNLVLDDMGIPCNIVPLFPDTAISEARPTQNPKLPFCTMAYLFAVDETQEKLLKLAFGIQTTDDFQKALFQQTIGSWFTFPAFQIGIPKIIPPGKRELDLPLVRPADKCALCEGNLSEPRALSNGKRVRWCKRCHLVFLMDMNTPILLMHDECIGYYSNDFGLCCVDPNGVKEDFRNFILS